MARRKFPRSVFDSINVTPLIDTLFFLLIIFMITAPLLEYSVDVSPPQMNAAPMKPDERSKIVNVKADGTIIYDRSAITEEALQAVFHQIISSNPAGDVPLFLRGDKNVIYGRMMQIMKMARSAGFKNIQLVMEEEPKK